MGYQQALEANGVVIKNFKEFGDYQGTWIAELEDGRFIEGSYGSCSGCDAFQSEFGYHEELERLEDGKYHKDNYSWEEEVSDDEAIEHNRKLAEKLRLFGEGYLNSSETREEIIKRYDEKIKDEWAWEDDKQIFEWLINLK